MFGIGSGEILLVLIIIFLIYGPDRLPEMAQKVGKIARDVRKASDEVKETVARQLDPIQNPIKKLTEPVSDSKPVPDTKSNEKKSDEPKA